MGKLIKILLISFASILGLLIVAIVIIPFIVDLNHYKAEIQTAVKEKTGRDLIIEGNIDLSLFPWIGISTGKMTLSNANGFAKPYFAVIGASDIKVKLMPLFSKHLEVNTITFKGLALNLAKNKQGVSNWADLSDQSDTQAVANEQKPDQPDVKTNEPLLAALAIGGVHIERANIHWDDQQAGQQLDIKDFTLKTGAITGFNQAVTLELSLLVENSQPQLTEKFTLSTQLSLDKSLQKIQLAQLTIHSNTQGEIVPGGHLDLTLNTDIDLNLTTENLALNSLRLDSNLFNLQSPALTITQFKTVPQYAGHISIAEFNPKKLLQTLAMDVPSTRDSTVLQKLALQFQLQGTSDSVALNDLQLSLDDTTLKGSTDIQHFSKPAIRFDLDIDTLNIDRYTAPESPAVQKTTQVATPATAAAVTANLIPVDTLRQLNIEGQLKINTLKVSQLDIGQFSLNLRAKKGILRSQQRIEQLYQGRYHGVMTVNAQTKTPTISLNEHLQQVQLEPLVHALQPDTPAKIKGRANINAVLTMRGNSIPAFKSSLNGQLDFNIAEGAIRGINIQKMIDMGKLALDGKQMRQAYKNEQTLFSSLKASATIKQGVVNNPDFLLESSTLAVNGQGTVNLVNEALNYKIHAKLKQNPNNKKIVVRGRPIAINVSGSLSQPSYSLDVMAMITDHEKKKINKAVNKVIDKVIDDKTKKTLDKVLGKDSGKAVNQLLNSFF